MKLKNIFVNFKNKISSLYSKNKKLFVFTCVLIAVVLLCFFAFPKTSSLTKTKTKTEQNTKSLNQTTDYSERLAGKIEEMLLAIDEVKQANVLVVCESTEIYDYLKNRKETTSGGEDKSTTLEENVAYEKEGSSSTPIIITTKMPKVVGVWVIINTVSASTKLAITNSISSVLNIDETSISILQER